MQLQSRCSRTKGKSISALCVSLLHRKGSRRCRRHIGCRYVHRALDDHLNDRGYIVPGLGDAEIVFSAQNKGVENHVR